ncbi:MAG: hypothetical protein ACTSU2_13180 [Promethearchaeota archaeon]
MSVTWKDVLNWGLIEELFRNTTGKRLSDEEKENGIKKLEEKYSKDELFEKEPTELEKELLSIYLKDYMEINNQVNNKFEEDMKVPFDFISDLFSDEELELFKDILPTDEEFEEFLRMVMNSRHRKREDNQRNRGYDIYI